MRSKATLVNAVALAVVVVGVIVGLLLLRGGGSHPSSQQSEGGSTSSNSTVTRTVTTAATSTTVTPVPADVAPTALSTSDDGLLSAILATPTPGTAPTTYPNVGALPTTVANTTPLVLPGAENFVSQPIPADTPQRDKLIAQNEQLLQDRLALQWDDKLIDKGGCTSFNQTRYDLVARDVTAAELAKFDFCFSLTPLNQQIWTEYKVRFDIKFLGTYAVPRENGMDYRTWYLGTPIATAGPLAGKPVSQPVISTYATDWVYQNGNWVMDESFR
jgi:hypothetical protein